MGSSHSRVKDQLTRQEIQEIATKSKLSEHELEENVRRFYKEYPSGTMTKHQFIEECLSLRGGKTELWSTVFDQFDQDKNGVLDVHEFLVSFTVVCSGNIENKIKMIFAIFDKDKSGKISKQEMTEMVYYLSRLSSFYFSENSNPLPLELEHVDTFFEKADLDKDGQITYEEFNTAVLKNRELKLALTSWLDEEIVVASPSNRQRKALNEVAFLLKDFFTDISLPEFTKGIILVHARQRQSKNKLKFRFSPSEESEVPADLPLRAWKYARWSGAAYGWKMLHTFLSDLSFTRSTLKVIKDSVTPSLDTNLTAMLSYLGITKEEIVVADWVNDVFRPGHYIALNHKEKEIIFAIRGTISIMDALTDLVASNAPFLEGYAHAGMSRAALYLYELRIKTVKALSEKYPDYKLQVVGHSLGAGVGALLLMLFLKDGIDCHCWAYSCPVILDPVTAEKYKHKITSFVYHNDFVPRLSMETINLLRKDIIEETSENNLVTAIGTIFGSPLPSRRNKTSEHQENSSSPKTSHEVVAHERPMRQFGPSEKVVAPGRMFHVGAKGKGAELKYVIFSTDYSRYNYMKLSRTMFSDHMPDRYHDCFIGLMRQYPNRYERPSSLE